MSPTRDFRRPPRLRAARAVGALAGRMLLVGLLGGWIAAGPAAADDSPAPAGGAGAVPEGEERGRPAPEALAGGDPPVECLLPADITRLGGQIPHVGPRRLVEVPAAECRSRGGEEVAPGAGPAPDPPR